MTVPAIIKKTEDTKKFINAFRPIVADYATRDYDHNAWLKTAMLCIMESEELQKCMTTQEGQASLYHALRFAAGTGLSLNPQEGKAALIAYASKVEYQVMKGGMIELAMSSGKVEFITADIVYAGDEFEIEKAMDGDRYRFRPALADRGNALGYFAALKMTDGTVHVKWIDRANMEDHKERYAKGLTYTYDDKQKGIKKGEPKKNHAWNKSFDGMAIKTVLKALLRSLEISPDLTRAVVSDDISESGGDILDITPEPEQPGTTSTDVREAMTAPADPEPVREAKAEGPAAADAEAGKADGSDGKDLF